MNGHRPSCYVEPTWWCWLNWSRGRILTFVRKRSIAPRVDMVARALQAQRDLYSYSFIRKEKGSIIRGLMAIIMRGLLTLSLSFSKGWRRLIPLLGNGKIPVNDNFSPSPRHHPKSDFWSEPDEPWSGFEVRFVHEGAKPEDCRGLTSRSENFRRHASLQ